MKNCVGAAVRGSDFWNRENELQNIWDAIESGSHILLAAPRRVGKTSIMFYLKDNPKSGYIVVYIDTESADSENEFWHKLFNALSEEEFINKLKSRSKEAFAKLKSVKLKKISTSGVEFDDGKMVEYIELFEDLVKNLDIDKKLVILVDEFAQTVENIIKYDSTESAEAFLKTNRSLRQNPKISEKITFLYAGSIGLESVAAKIGGTKFINDLNSIKVSPLQRAEALAFSKELCKSVNISLNNETLEYMLDKIEWFIPFYIQLIIEQLKSISRQNGGVLSPTDIDKSINNAIEHKNHFEHWHSKLKSFENASYLFAKDVLSQISESATISSLEIQNLAAKYNVNGDDARETIHSLVYDGYINNNDDAKIYRFNSPVLRAWWSKYVAN